MCAVAVYAESQAIETFILILANVASKGKGGVRQLCRSGPVRSGPRGGAGSCGSAVLVPINAHGVAALECSQNN